MFEEIMDNIIYIIKKINSALQSKKTKEKIERNEIESIAQECPLLVVCCVVILIFAIASLWKNGVIIKIIKLQ